LSQGKNRVGSSRYVQHVVSLKHVAGKESRGRVLGDCNGVHLRLSWGSISSHQHAIGILFVIHRPRFVPTPTKLSMAEHLTVGGENSDGQSGVSICRLVWEGCDLFAIDSAGNEFIGGSRGAGVCSNNLSVFGKLICQSGGCRGNARAMWTPSQRR
jgi:hypothetical protein